MVTLKSKQARHLVAVGIILLFCQLLINPDDYISPRSRSLSSNRDSESSYDSPGTIAVVINTAGTATESLFRTFRKSWHCNNRSPVSEKIQSLNCRGDRLAFRTHSFDTGSTFVQQYRDQHPDGRCLVITAIQSPASWFSSLFLQRTKAKATRTKSWFSFFIKRKAKNMWKQKEEPLQNFKKFLASDDLFKTFHRVLPHLLKEFNAGSLIDQLQIMNQNDGYSLIGPASTKSPFSGCELLFLRLEEKEKWPEILQNINSNIKFEEEISLVDQYPENLNEIKLVENYELTFEERMAISSRGGPFFQEWFNAYGYLESKSFSNPGTVAAVINTPKMGTGGLFLTFGGSWHCRYGPSPKKLIILNCKDDRMALRTHWFNAGMQQIERHRKEHSEGQCLIVTSLRSPVSWFPSFFLQKMNGKWKAKEEMLKEYKKFLASDVFLEPLETALPDLLKEFNAGSLREQARIMDQNEGYSFLSAPPESAVMGCNLLFLRMEDSARWPQIFYKLDPDIRFTTGVSRKDQNPENIDQIEIIANYKLSFDEKVAIHTKGGPFVADWFDAYGYMENSVE